MADGGLAEQRIMFAAATATVGGMATATDLVGCKTSQDEISIERDFRLIIRGMM